MVFEFLNSVGAMVDPVFNPLLVFNPAVTLFLFATIITAIVFALNKLFVNQKLVKEMREKTLTLREKLAIAQKEGRKEEVNNMLNEMMSIQNEVFKQTFKVAIISSLVVILLFPWANHRFSGMTVVTHPVVTFLLSALTTVPLINLLPWSNWLVWYILSAISINWLLSKFIGVQR